MAWQEEERGRCGGCGQRLADTVGMDNVDRWEAVLHTCDGCRERERAAKKYESNGGDTRGLKISLRDIDAG